jgi:hypothetical protein
LAKLAWLINERKRNDTTVAQKQLQLQFLDAELRITEASKKLSASSEPKEVG